MALTEHFGIPKPVADPTISIADEFYRLQEAWDVVDAAMKAILDNANGRAPGTHTHAISAVTGLADALAGKMPADTTFSLDDLSDVDGAAGAPTGYLLVKNSLGQYAPSAPSAALGAHGHLISEITGLSSALAARPERSEVEAGLELLGGETADDLAAAVAALTAEINKRGVPLGTMVHSAVPLESQGFLLADGSPCTPTTPDLRAALLAADSPFGNNGVDPLLPDEVTANRFRRAAGGALALGAVQEDAIRNITGSVSPHGTIGITSVAQGTVSGAFKKGANKAAFINPFTGAGNDLEFDASLVVPTADENRPKSIAYLPYIKAFGGITIEGMADLSALFNALATKTEAEAGADNTKLMTALRTKEAIDARKGTTGALALSGAQFDVTGIPTVARRVKLKLAEVSLGAGVAVYIQLGTAAGVETAGYKISTPGRSTSGTNTSTSTAAIVIALYSSATGPYSGIVELERVGNTNNWIATSLVKLADSAGAVGDSVGFKAMTGGALDRLRITTAAGTATLSGSIEVEWEK